MEPGCSAESIWEESMIVSAVNTHFDQNWKVCSITFCYVHSQLKLSALQQQGMVIS